MSSLLALLTLTTITAVDPAARGAGFPKLPDQYVAQPLYERQPGSGAFAKAYPRRAFAEGVPLAGALDCRVTAEGGLDDCALVGESRSGYGFEAAAVQIAAQVQVSPYDGGGEPVSGRRVLYSLHFDPPVLGSTDDAIYLDTAACAGLALARGESAPYTPESRQAVSHWIMAYYAVAVRSGLTPADSAGRLDALRKKAQAELAAGKVAADADAKCAARLQRGPT